VSLVFATRDPQGQGLDLAPLIQYGASPRATLALTLASKANAFLNGRGYVTPQDVKTIGPDVLRHRVIVTYEAEAEEGRLRRDRPPRVRRGAGPLGAAS
jgi:MoxR-like ATPase